MNQLLADPALIAVLGGLLLTYCRVQGCFMLLPVFSDGRLPLRVRVSLAMAVTPLLAGHAQAVPQIGGPLQLSLLVGAEVLSGLVLGGLVRIFAAALDVAATAIAATASLSQIVGVANEYSPHPVGNLMHLAGLAVVLALGFPVAVCELLRDSLVLRPLGAWPEISVLLPGAVAIVGRSFVLAMVLAAPFVLGGFLYQLLSGMINKVMPSLPVVFIGAPAAILLALVALALLTPSLLSVWADALLAMMEGLLE